MTRSIAAAPLLSLILISAQPVPSPAANSVEREFRFSGDAIRLTQVDGRTEVRVRDAMPTFEAGQPDLPWVGELIDLPDGARVTSVRVLEIETEPLAASVRLPSAQVVRPGLGPLERTAEDPAAFARAGFQPETPVVLGVQGFRQGRSTVALRISPVRWDASTGALERVTRLRVRLELGAAESEPLRRLRDASQDLGTARRAVAASAQSVSPDPRGFQPTLLPSVLGSPVEYVIITDGTLESEFQRLADWKTNKGIPAVVRTMAVIKQEYPNGADDADRVRQFIRDAYTRWGTQYVLLGGDVHLVPTRFARTIFYGGENIPCDMYFSCLDGNWNADGDSVFGEGFTSVSDPGDNVDLLPEVYVGRAAVSSLADADLFVDKTLQYEKTPVGDYENSVLFFAEVLFPQDWEEGQLITMDGAQLAEECTPSLQAHPGIRYVRMYENYTDPLYEPGAYPISKQAVIDSLDRGYNIAVHIGHGYRNVMAVGHGENLDNSNALGLSNGNRLFNLYATNCTSAAIDFPCIGEAFILAPNGGAVTNVGSTRLDFPSAGRAYQKEYFRLVYEDSITAIGEAQAMQKLPFVVYSNTDNVNRWTQFTLLLLGDPELRLYTALPRTLDVIHPGSMFIGDSTASISVQSNGNPVAGATVVLHKLGDEYRRGTTNASGICNLLFRPDSIGAVTLTVTAYDARPYQAAINISGSFQPVMAERLPVLDDDSVGGTIGNANGKLDAGETVGIVMQVKNAGWSNGSSITGTLSTTEPFVSILQSSVSYGTVSAGATTNTSSAYRISIPANFPDEREIRFKLLIADGSGRRWDEGFSLISHARELRHLSHTVADPTGNGNGIAEAGETVNYVVRLLNYGTTNATTVSAILRSIDGLATITDSTSSFGGITAGQEKNGDAFVFHTTSSNALLQLRVTDSMGSVFNQTLDLIPPAAPLTAGGAGSATSIKLYWTKSPEPDLQGYLIDRGSDIAGPFSRLTAVPTDRIAYYVDEGLSALTRYYYRVTAVDSSGNNSAPSAVFAVSTNPPTHPFFPIPMPTASASSVAIEHVWPGHPLSIVVGSGRSEVGSGNVLFGWNPDGTAPIDADGSIATSGDLTTRGLTYTAPPSVGDLDDDGQMEIVASSWDSMMTFVFQRDGTVRPGWPVQTDQSVWSSAALGDLDGDGDLEVVFGSNGQNIYAFNHNGTEVRDGDNNVSTVGVWRRADTGFNYSTPSLADLDGDGKAEVIIGSSNGWIYAQRWNGTPAPGWNQYRGGAGVHIYGSLAVGHLDGVSDTELDIVVPIQRDNKNDSLLVIRANGQNRAGWPQKVEIGGGSLPPSPALADMNNDGFLDIVYAGTDGLIYAFNRNGTTIAPLHGTRYSSLTRTPTTFATEASPVIADINGDGQNDIVIGDELGFLTAISANGTVLAGFPIQTGAEIKATAGLCDCDADGMTEIVVPGMDEHVHMWDYDFPFHPAGSPPWPQFHHDARRTGLVTTPQWTGVEDPPPVSSPVRTLEFAAPSPNPAPHETRIAWGVPTSAVGSEYAIEIYDLSGRRVRVLARGTAEPGRFSAMWNLRNDEQRPIESGVYFVRFRLGREVRSHRIAVLR
jgi:Peptidase family C25/FG-GAP-like repeat